MLSSASQEDWALEMSDCQAISQAWMRPRDSCQDLRFLLLAQPLHIVLVLIVFALLVLQCIFAMDFACTCVACLLMKC